MGALDGRVAVITGAGRGIGREHALLFAAEGAKVVVNDLGGGVDGSGDDATAAEAVVEEIAATGGEALANHDNVADWDGAQRLIAQAVERFGQLDALVLNAGILRDAFLHKMTEAEWDAVVNVHLKGHFAPLRHAAEHWRARSKAGEAVSGAVVTTASDSGTNLPNPGQINYGAAKAGIAAMSLVAAAELGRLGVRVNCLVPAARTRLTLQTPGIGDMVKAPEDPDAFDPWHPKHIAPLVAYLCSSDCGLTGKVFRAMGSEIHPMSGWSMGDPLKAEDGWTIAKVADALSGAAV